jgi:hypothetical protein
VSHARTPVDVQQQPSHVAPLGRMRPKGARRATQLLPEDHTRSANGPLFVRDRSQVCAGRSPAWGAFPHPFAVFLPSGGGRNRTRFRGRPLGLRTQASRPLASQRCGHAGFARRRRRLGGRRADSIRALAWRPATRCASRARACSYLVAGAVARSPLEHSTSDKHRRPGTLSVARGGAQAWPAPSTRRPR